MYETYLCTAVGNKFRAEETGSYQHQTEYFDGFHYATQNEGTKIMLPNGAICDRMVFEDTQNHSPQLVSMARVFSLSGLQAANFKVVGQRTDPQFGTIVELDNNVHHIELAKDRSWMMVGLTDKNREFHVLEMKQFNGHWIPLRSEESFPRKGLVVETTATFVRNPYPSELVFRPIHQPNTLITTGRESFYVDKNGKSQPIPRSPGSSSALARAFTPTIQLMAAMLLGTLVVCLAFVAIAFRRKPDQ